MLEFAALHGDEGPGGGGSSGSLGGAAGAPAAADGGDAGSVDGGGSGAGGTRSRAEALEKAEEYLQRALLSYEETLGPDNAHVANAHEGLVRVFMQQGRLELASTHLERALEIRTKAQRIADGKLFMQEELMELKAKQLHLKTEKSRIANKKLRQAGLATVALNRMSSSQSANGSARSTGALDGTQAEASGSKSGALDRLIRARKSICTVRRLSRAFGHHGHHFGGGHHHGAVPPGPLSAVAASNSRATDFGVDQPSKPRRGVSWSSRSKSTDSIGGAPAPLTARAALTQSQPLPAAAAPSAAPRRATVGHSEHGSRKGVCFAQAVSQATAAAGCSGADRATGPSPISSTEHSVGRSLRELEELSAESSHRNDDLYAAAATVGDVGFLPVTLASPRRPRALSASKRSTASCGTVEEDSDLRMSGAAMPPLRVIARPSSDDVIAFAVRKSAGSPRRHDVAPPDLTPRGDGGDVPGVESSDLSGLIV